MSYSKRYRERTIEYRQAGHSLEETHQIFKVSKSTIQKWEKQLKETGNLEKKKLHRSFRKIDPARLKAYVAEHPDAYQSEMAEAFGCSESGIRYALRRHKITRKKDDPLSGAGPAKSSSVSGGDQGYPAGKNRLCGRKRYRYIPVSGIWVCAEGPTGVWTSSWPEVPALRHCRCSKGRQNSCALSV